jgi:group I intron endonuclease
VYTVYKHTNSINGKAYIGVTKQTMQRRWIQHLASSRFKGRQNYHLHFMRALRKYSKTVWVHEILEENILQKNINNKEIYYIQKYNTFKQGYNSCSGGISNFKTSVKTRRKISKANKGRKHTKEVCNAAQLRNSGKGNPMYGKKQTQKTKEAVRNRVRGTADKTLRNWVHKTGKIEKNITCLALRDKYPELHISKLNAVAKKLVNKKGYRIGISHKYWSILNE